VLARYRSPRSQVCCLCGDSRDRRCQPFLSGRLRPFLYPVWNEAAVPPHASWASKASHSPTVPPLEADCAVGKRSLRQCRPHLCCRPRAYHPHMTSRDDVPGPSEGAGSDRRNGGADGGAAGPQFPPVQAPDRAYVPRPRPATAGSISIRCGRCAAHSIFEA
jgi:hypothetical protein